MHDFVFVQVFSTSEDVRSTYMFHLLTRAQHEAAGKNANKKIKDIGKGKSKFKTLNSFYEPARAPDTGGDEQMMIQDQ